MNLPYKMVFTHFGRSGGCCHQVCGKLLSKGSPDICEELHGGISLLCWSEVTVGLPSRKDHTTLPNIYAVNHYCNLPPTDLWPINRVTTHDRKLVIQIVREDLILALN